MNNRKTKKELVGPWRSIHIIIWVVGLYILFSRGWFFPGILILVAISALYEGLLDRFAPHAFEEQPSNKPSNYTGPTPGTMTAPASSVPPQEHRVDLLPSTCPNCSGPIRGHEVKWTGLQSANCPYCGSNLPMSKG